MQFWSFAKQFWNWLAKYFYMNNKDSQNQALKKKITNQSFSNNNFPVAIEP